MENSKYYTPVKEEFHIGFEYEKLQEKEAGYYNKTTGTVDRTFWHRFIYDSKSIRLSQLDSHLFENTIRVKCLDKEDIISCGFLYKGMAQSIVEEYFTETKNYGDTQTGYNLLRNTEKGFIVISYWEQAVGFVGDEKYILFHGYVKNKQEFKKLMQQLNIS
jgi:hypothetical protein